ncbi:FCD domain-containing protein [Paenirhodobacter populi]|uniref:Pyruvate dehydrogenase complex repressor n=1 Tax=Paenirhodobacter populi TaxID=2306993 RepID=A0A443J4J3_9RHOB|nr:FCD domain-containing protein [Sinirhodobacter populi]RWR15581.1 FCD domain-containing protein [Sinirhodobacter populi]RWR18986.1 FCD domain-containing protein [Sinirhodobacter populi]
MAIPLKSEPAAQVVARHIEALILEGSLVPGEPLRSERDLAEQFAVSRPTLRDGLRILVDKGLLRQGAGRGLEVAPLGTSITDPLIALLAAHGEVADDYLEFRDIVECSAAAYAAVRANDIDRDRLRECLDRIARAHAAADPQEEADADTELHQLIYEASHNLVLLQIMRALSDSLRQDVIQNRGRLFSIPTIRETLRDQHVAIAQAILDGDAKRAQAAAHDHLTYLRQAAREVRMAQEKLDLSLRRLQRGGVGVPG